MTTPNAGPRLILDVTPRLVVAALVAVVALSCLLLAATAVAHDLSGTPGEAGWLFKVLVRFNLGNENNFGAWFSSSLLASIAAVAVLCLLAEGAGTSRGLSGPLGWSFVALLFAGLSLDELGSLHERLPEIEPSLTWVLWLGPFIVAVPVFLGIFGYVRLRHRLLSVGLLTLGIAAFCLVPLQEYLEFLPTDGRPRQAWQVVAEEGSELFGMTAFLGALLCYLISDPTQRQQVLVARRIDLGFDAALLRAAAVAAAVLLGIVCQATDVFWHQEGDLFGRVQNWPTVAIATGLMLFGVIGASQPQFTGPARRALLLLVWLAAVASAFVGSDLHAMTDNAGLVWALRFAFAAISVALLTTAALASTGRPRALASAAAVLVVAGCLAPDWLAPHLYLASVLMAALAAIGVVDASLRTTLRSQPVG